MRWGLIVVIVALPALVVASACLGATTLSPAVFLHAWFAPRGDEAEAIALGVRVPRTVLGITVGAAFGTAGVVIQAVTRNPLADPGLLGVNAGAAFGVALGVTVLGLPGYGASLWLAAGGAAVATVVVAIVGGGRSIERLALAGVAIAAVLAGATNALGLTNPSAYRTLALWENGSLAGRDGTTVAVTLAVVAAGLVLAWSFRAPLGVLALGDDAARGLGARASLVRVVALVAITALCGAATAAAGPVAFVGLLVPHLLRAVVGADHRRQLPWAIVLGPIVVLTADLAARTLIRPQELPLGVVTAVIGAPALIVFVRRLDGARS